MLPAMKIADGAGPIGDALLEQGAVIVEGFLSDATVERVNAELDPVLAAAPTKREFVNPAIAGFFGEHTRHLTGIANHSPTFSREVLCHPLYEELSERVLGPTCSSWQMNIGHLLERGPSAEQQLIHRDQAVWPHLPEDHPVVELASIVALRDFTADNGATRVVPGSHEWTGDQEHYPTDDELEIAEMPAGSAVIYLGTTYHAGGGNVTTDEWRRGFHLSFVVGWLRTEENNTLATPPDIARTLPRRAQELLGYGVHDAIDIGGGYLGTVDVRDPVVMLESGEL